MLGRLAESIDPIRSPEFVEVHRSFAEPIGAPETIAKYVAQLVRRLCHALQAKGLGVRRTDLIVHRVDNTVLALRAGTAKPVRDIRRLTKLLHDRIERIDAGFGLEKLSLAAIMVEPLDERQRRSTISLASRTPRRVMQRRWASTGEVEDQLKELDRNIRAWIEKYADAARAK